MTRFITPSLQQEDIETRSSLLHYVLITGIVMEVITFPKLPVIGVAPINVVVLVGLLMIVVNYRQLPKLSPVIVKIILLLLFFDVYGSLLAWALGKKDTTLSFFEGIRECIELTLFAFACARPIELKRLLFALNAALVTSAIFGLLIYHIGDPFQTIRSWLLQDTDVKTGISGKGFWVSGLSGEHFLFGYVMAAAPVIAFVLSQLSNVKWVWYVLLALLLYTLHLNAERAALIGAILGIAYLIRTWRLLKPVYVSIGISLFLTASLLSSPSPKTQKIDDTKHKASLSERVEGADALERLHWLETGIVSVLNHPATGVNHQQYAEAYFDQHLMIINSPDRETVPPHNHYVDPGLDIGIIGWVIVLLYLWEIKSILIQVFNAKIKDSQTKIVFEGIPIALVSVMTVALFHNTGIFYGEPVTVCLTGMLISAHQTLYNNRKAYETTI